MANSLMQIISDGSLSTIPLTIKFFEQSHIKVFVNNVELPDGSYNFVWSGATTITITPTVALGAEVSIRRKTPANEVLHDFQAGAVFSEVSVDENFRQELFLLQEASEQSFVTDLYADLDMHGNKVQNLADAILGRDATPLVQVQQIVSDSGGNPYVEAQLRELAKRSYAEAGYSLTSGSFESGGEIVNNSDVLLHKASGKAFSGTAGTIVAGTNPLGGGFVDASDTVYGMATVAGINTGMYGVGTHLMVSDRDGGIFVITSGGTPNGTYRLDAGSGKTAVLYPNPSGVSIECFGVTAGIDAYDGIRSANDYSNEFGVPIVFKENTEYLSLHNFEFNKPINWVSSSGTRGSSTIRIAESGGIGVLVKGAIVLATTLSSDIPIFSSSITVGSTAGVSVGDLCYILSNKPFYGVPVASQGELKKGHLCRVSKVTGPNSVEFESAINDSYLLSEELVRIEFHRPVNSPYMRGIAIEKDWTVDSAVAVEFECCYKPVVDDCAFLFARGYGIEYDKCYLGEINRCFGQGATYLYQFRVNGSYGVKLTGLETTQTNKAVDLSGISIPARNVVVKDCLDHHGGVDHLGASLFKKGTGFGSHWCCDGATWINCTTRDRFRGFYQRGISEKFHNCKALGAMAQSPFQLENTKDVSLVDCEYNSELLPVKGGAVTNFHKKITVADLGNIPDSFCIVFNTDGTGKNGQFSIKNCRAYGVQNRLALLRNDGVEFSDFEIIDNYTYVVNSGAANDISTVECIDALSPCKQFLVSGNEIQTNQGQTNVYGFGVNFTASAKLALGTVSVVPAASTYLINLNDDSVGIIYGGVRGDGVEVTARVAGVSGFYGSGILYRSGTFNSFGSSGFGTVGSFMTGTTGPDNSLNVSFIGSRFYVENRTGAKATILVTVSSPI